MLRLRFLTNKFQKRLIRPLYAQTQATPYAATLDASLGSGSSFVAPLSTDTTPAARSAAAFLLQSGLVPGTVMTRTTAGNVCVATGANSTSIVAFGLLANFVGGNLDELGDEVTVGVWRGPDAVFELLAPAFDDTGAGTSGGQALSTAYAAATADTGPVKLYAGADGRLVSMGTPANRQVVAHLIDRPAPSRIVIDLKV